MSRIERAGDDAPVEFGTFGGGFTTIDRSPQRYRPEVRSTLLIGMKDPCLEGWAATWGTPFLSKHGAGILEVGAFDECLKSAPTVRFLLDHDDDELIATTDDRLELHSDRKGLGFRLRLTDNGLAEMVAERKFDAVSVGYTAATSDTKPFTIDGTTITLVKRATLTEVSLVRRPAIKTTFANLVDAADRGTLASEMKAAGFGVESAYRRFMRTLGDYYEAVS